MNKPTDRPSELGGFLRARRSQLTPQEVGLPANRMQRRVPGLRREEVAQLACISVDYYTRLEQGRVQASATVLEVLARALRLDSDQRSYVYRLAGKVSTRPRRRPSEPVRPAMQRLLDHVTETPAMVLGRRLDILAWNAGAAALFMDFGRIPAPERNYVRLLFTDPGMRALHADWDDAARISVATLRMEAAHGQSDPQLSTLVGDLSLRDADFRRWWASHQVSSASYGTKHYQHPVVGPLTLDCDMWAGPDGTEQRLMVLTAEPGTPSHEALGILASWTAAPPLSNLIAAAEEPETG